MQKTGSMVGQRDGAWARLGRTQSGLNWRAAALLGLISSTFSTAVSQFVAERIGRDAVVDWMAVAAIPVGNGALHIDPPAWVIAAGILFHQWADFSWEITFFGLFGCWTARLRPWTILALAAPWALFTSAMEWLVLVPLWPFWQPIFPLEQPYWIGFLVHASSASLYPLFPLLRDWLAGRRDAANLRFAAVWSSGALILLVVLGVGQFLGASGRELPWAGHDLGADQAYMRRMLAHHAQGIELATLATQRATDPRLRQVAALMAAEQAGEIRIFRQWWQSWFATPAEICSPAELAEMPGMLTPAEMDDLRQAPDAAFDPMFIRLMTRHHRGAVQMADQQMHGDGDLRLRVMAQAIRHGQQGEIEMMRDTRGIAAVRAAIVAEVSAEIGATPPTPR